MGKLRVPFIVMCCLVSVLWSEAQGAEEINESVIRYLFPGYKEKLETQTAMTESLLVQNALIENSLALEREKVLHLMTLLEKTQESQNLLNEKIDLQTAQVEEYQGKIKNESKRRKKAEENLANIMQQERISIHAVLQRREDGLKIINHTSNFHCKYQANDQQAIDISYSLIGNTTLTKLEIGGGSSITNLGAAAIAKSLSINTTLTYLDLWGSRICDVGAIALAEALSMNTALITLNLINNGIRVEGAKALAKALEKNTTLKVLGLGDSAIDVEGAEALAKALEKNTTLTTLYLAGSGGKGIGYIGAKVLAQNTTLKSLCLWGHFVGDAGAEALAQNVTLKILDLQRNKIGDVGAKALAQNTTINKLILGNKNGNAFDSNNITSDGEEYFKNSQNPYFRDLSPLYAKHPNFIDFIL
jgi:hypothetical protein